LGEFGLSHSAEIEAGGYPKLWFEDRSDRTIADQDAIANPEIGHQSVFSGVAPGLVAET